MADDDQCAAGSLKPATSGRGNLVVPVINNVTSKEGCCAMCLKQPGCGGWTWGDTVVHGSCFLRLSNTAWYSQDGAVSGEATGPPAPPPFAFSNTLGDHAVLQNPIVIWGVGSPGLTVATVVSSSGWTKKGVATIGANGIWRQVVPHLPESLAPVTVVSTSGGKAIALRCVPRNSKSGYTSSCKTPRLVS